MHASGFGRGRGEYCEVVPRIFNVLEIYAYDAGNLVMCAEGCRNFDWMWLGAIRETGEQ